MPNRFEIILLDLNGTFMFQHDRFGPDQDYARAYRAHGGTRLEPAEVTAALDALVNRMAEIDANPLRYDSFPSVRSVLSDLESTRRWPQSELERIENIVALHELGEVPPDYAAVIRALAETHRLGLVSNLWSMKEPWLAALRGAELLDVFEWVVFSSDGRSVKPSAKIFKPILRHWGGDRAGILMVGDSLERDVAGAHAAGVKAMWVSDGKAIADTNTAPDYQVTSLLDLAEWCSGA